MASKGSASSKIPKLRTPPASPRGSRGRGQTPVALTAASVASPLQASSKQSMTLSASGNHQPKIPLPVQSQQKRGATQTRPNAPPTIGSTDAEKPKKGNADVISHEEVNRALTGMIMPTSDHDLGKCFALSSISEEESLDTTDPPEAVCKGQSEMSEDESRSPSQGNAIAAEPEVSVDILDVTRSFFEDVLEEAAREASTMALDREERKAVEKALPPIMEMKDEVELLQEAEINGNDDAMTEVKVHEDVPPTEIADGPLVETQEDADAHVVVAREPEEEEAVLLPETKPSPLHIQTGTSLHYYKLFHQSKSSMTIESEENGPADDSLPGSQEVPSSHDELCQYQLDGQQEEECETIEITKMPSEKTATLNDGDLVPQHESDFEEDIEIERFVINTDTESEMETEDVTATFEGKRMASTKRPKTIFSVDVPWNKAQIESGPGENGDGCGVHSPQGKSITNAAESCVFPLESGTETQEMPDDPLRNFCERKMGDEHNGILEAAEKVVNGIVETWSSGATKASSNDSMMAGSERDGNPFKALVENEETVGCRASVSSNLILQRGSGRNQGFFKLITVNNPTASLYAFKVCCAESSLVNLTASPSVGLVGPGSCQFVEIRATPEKEMERVTVNGKIQFKIFPANGTDCDPKKINKSYQILADRCPSMIHTQTVDRIIAWDGGNLQGNLEFFDSVQDEDERHFLKEKIKTCESLSSQSRVSVSGNGSQSPSALLISIKEQLVIANRTLQETFQELGFMKSSLNAVFGIGLFLVGYVTYDFFIQWWSPPVSVPEPSWLEKMASYLPFSSWK